MAATALAQEKIWVDKPSYDKAECLFHERAAKLGTCCKVVSRKNLDQCLLNSNSCASVEQESPIITNIQTKAKPKKSKDNKASDNALSENAQNAKNQTKSVKSSKKREEPALEKEEVLENESKEAEVSPNSNGKKYKAKEAKEKKNKADKKHRNKEEDKGKVEESKDKLLSQGNPESTCSVLPTTGGSLANEVAKARQHIKQSLQCMDGIAAMAGVPSSQDVSSRVTFLEKENQELKNIVGELKSIVVQLDKRVLELEATKPQIAICPAKPSEKKPVPAQAEEEDDVDLFGSDSEGEDEEAAKIREERLAAYNAKKSKKPVLIAKSNIILDVKPWDDETDMKALEAEVRKVQTDGLLWGAAKLVPLAYGIQKLQISCVVEDDKVSVDWLTETIQEKEDYVQSVDIAAFNKV
ncbi:probable elongation factor 1-delta isoform X1 [Belonocnema kinseyi]|nr:probable elongation factor 1-delta isoform X1 [Belonocnema kinseyi]